jgi:hypothetical protein
MTWLVNEPSLDVSHESHLGDEKVTRGRLELTYSANLGTSAIELTF